jgi:hypothetical protein
MNYSPNKINRLYPDRKTAALCKLGITFSYIIYSYLLVTTDLTQAVVAHGESDCWMFVNSNRYIPGKITLSWNAVAPHVRQVTTLFSTLFRLTISVYKLGFKLVKWKPNKRRPEIPNLPRSKEFSLVKDINLSQWPTWCTNVNTFITILYMYIFRAISCSSSGGQIVLTRLTPN